MDRSICNSYKTMYWQTNPVWDEEVDHVQKVSLAEPDEADEAEYVDDEEVEVQKVSLPEPVKPVSPCKCGQR